MTDKLPIIPLRKEEEKPLQAADWLAKLDRGNLTKAERAAFTVWINSDPKNKDEINDLSSMWYELNDSLSMLASVSPVHSEKDNLVFLNSVQRLFAYVFSNARYALVMVGLLGLVTVLGYAALMQPSETGYYSTEIGEQREITLSDGSKVTLNTNTIIEQKYSGKERVLRLVSGEAIFDVAHNETRPFLVYASDGMIRAVGTKFSVRMQPNSVSVVVTEGAVELKERKDTSRTKQSSALAQVSMELKQQKAVLVTKGQLAEINRETGMFKQETSDRDIEERLSWQHGQLVFYNRQLQSVIDDIARYTLVDIQVRDEALKSRNITGILQIGDVDLMLEGLEAALNIKADKVSPGLIIINIDDIVKNNAAT